MTTTTAARISATNADAGLVYVNGIDADTGAYVVPPVAIGDLAKNVWRNARVGAVTDLWPEGAQTRGLPFELEIAEHYDNLEKMGWGSIRLKTSVLRWRSLSAVRADQANSRFKELDYKEGEQTRDWYQRHGISPGGVRPAKIPYYLFLVGPPSLIPFEFQYLLGIEYAVGRLAFDTPAEYEHYARSIRAYESTTSVPNTKEIVYRGTHHPNDRATELGSSLLVSPLANGIEDATGDVTPPIAAYDKLQYRQKLFLAGDATKASLQNCSMPAGRRHLFL